ncbi:MAG: hypothetical protein KQI78_14595 [Deltaproteobacteria bacterium]|nr:hypothetical protein [Deltaproteobacteria bacterium]
MSCPEVTEQDPREKAREPDEAWVKEEAGAVWAEPPWDRATIVFAPSAATPSPISAAFLVCK